MGCGASRPELLLGPPEAEVDLRPEDNIYIRYQESCRRAFIHWGVRTEAEGEACDAVWPLHSGATKSTAQVFAARLPTSASNKYINYSYS